MACGSKNCGYLLIKITDGKKIYLCTKGEELIKVEPNNKCVYEGERNETVL